MVSQIRLKISIFSDFLSYVNFGPDNRLYEKYFLCSPLKAYDSTRGSPTNRFLKPTSITMGIVWLMMSSTTQSNEYRAVKRNLLRLLIRLVISFSLYGLLSQIVERGSGLVLWPALYEYAVGLSALFLICWFHCGMLSSVTLAELFISVSVLSILMGLEDF